MSWDSSHIDEQATIIGPTPVEQASIPLCVDLDGTLVKTDTLWEALILLLKTSPWRLVSLPIWLARGKAAFKQEVCRRVTLDVTMLPYNQDLLCILSEAHWKGRQVVLVTAADRRIADQVASHVGLFSEVLASDGTVNLGGARKRATLERRFGRRAFDYVGNGHDDIRVWEGRERAGGNATPGSSREHGKFAKSRNLPVPAQAHTERCPEHFVYISG